MTITKQLSNISHNHWYWLIYMIGGISLIVTALFYQYVFDEMPCTMCIHVRLWIALFIIVSFIGLLTRKNNIVSALVQLSNVLITIALVERSYQLLGTERGFVFGSCGFDLGLPAWFAINEWLPWLFRVETTCGYTPELLFGITMAEALIVLSVLLLIVSFSVFLASLINIFHRD